MIWNQIRNLMIGFNAWRYTPFPLKGNIMNLEKSKKRIAKRVKMSRQGYPEITIEYFGKAAGCADGVSVKFCLEEGAEIQEQRFSSVIDAREDEAIQSAMVKIIERSEAMSVVQIEGVTAVG